MNLTNSQKEYLLELLSGEYLSSEEYQPILKHAIYQYQSTNYTAEELDFLSSLPLSLTADLYLTHNQPFNHFAARFALWLNVIEYNMCDNDSNALYLINPDPTSTAKILRLEKSADNYTYTAVPPLYFANNPRHNPTINANNLINQSPLYSIWNYTTAENMLQSFLNFAKQNPAKIPENHQDYLFNFEDNLKRTKEKRFSWENLRQKALAFPTAEENYIFLDRSQGLITPSTLQFISLINSKPVKTIIKRVAQPKNTFSIGNSQNNILHKLKNILKNPPAPAIPHPPKRRNSPFSQLPLHLAHPTAKVKQTAQPQNHYAKTNHAPIKRKVEQTITQTIGDKTADNIPDNLAIPENNIENDIIETPNPALPAEMIITEPVITPINSISYIPLNNRADNTAEIFTHN